MKKHLILTVAVIALSFLNSTPANADNNSNTLSATEVTVPATESVKSFARPTDPRFQYSLPQRKKSYFKKSNNGDDTDEITLDENVKPAKKIIKVMSAEQTESSAKNVDRSNIPMNYDSFPKYYDANDMSTQQFMPMMSF